MISLRPYQQDCKDAFYSYYQVKDGHGLIVVPTAGGKSIIIGSLATEIVQSWPGQRILILSHVKELLQQNLEKIMLCWPSAPAGLYSAGLGKRQSHHPITVASIQSVYKKAHILGHRDLLFIDEAHLLQPSAMGMYGMLIAALLAINPQMKICGFTATDFRLDSGLLTEGEGAIFTDVMIEIPIKKLLEEGYLTPPISKASIVQANMEGVKHTAGEFNIKEMAARFDQRAFIEAALDNDKQFFEGRRSIALFCATVENAEHVAEAMTARGIPTEVIHGEMKAEEREDILKRFKSGALRGLVSVGVITTGTDIPNMDCIVLFRATESPGLYQQIVGRGFRVVYVDGYDLNTREGRINAIRKGPKPDFLILDHGGNIERHGAIVYVQKPKKKEKGKRQAPLKADGRICEVCRSWWPLEVTICGQCGAVLVAQRDPTAGLDLEASNADIMGTPFTRGEKADWFPVEDVGYKRHSKAGSVDSLRVTYYSGILQFSEWIHFERAERFLKEKAVRWWGTRTHLPVPKTIDEVMANVGRLAKPLRVMVKKKDSRFYEVLQYGFQPVEQESSDSAA